MKRLIGVIIVSGFLIVVYAQAPLFLDPDSIQANGLNIDVGRYGSPYAYDWDEDGKKDLIIGQFTSGAIRFYKNIGTHFNPVFGNYVWLQADGLEIILPAGWCQGSSVVVCDWNEDGQRDLVAGDRDGYLTLFLETGSGLTNAGHIQANGVDIQVSNNSNPDINDWNEDGKKDLIVGEEENVLPNTGNVRLYLNAGTNSAPIFNDYTILEAGGNQIYRFQVNPRIYNLDQDSLKDLILGESDGCVYFYKNIGTNANPVFDASYDTLRTEGGTIINVYDGSRFHFVDWTGDGDPDMLISGFYGYVELYENATVGIQEESTKELVKMLTITPNPVNNKAVFEYSLNRRTFVQIDIYSADGRRVALPISRYEENGNQRFIWNVCDDSGKKLPAGVYFIEFQAGRETIAGRIIVVR